MFNMLNLYNLRSFVYKMDIWQEVFGKIKASVVVGSIPDVDEMNKIFKLELNFMESGLQNMSNSELESEKICQIKSEDLVNSRPGAMAMSQKKIRMFTKYSRMYIDKIDCELQVRAS